MADEVVYVTFLLLHIGFGAVLLDRVPQERRRLICTAVGIGTSVLLTRWEFLHQLTLLIAIIGAVKAHRRRKLFHLHFVLNAISFGYLLYFRFQCQNNFSNMIMMIMVLRMGSLGIEPGISTDPPEDPTQPVREVSTIDIFHYAFSYIGFLCGPYIRLRTYLDYVNGICPTTFAQRRAFLKVRLLQLPILGALFGLSALVAPVHSAKMEEFHAEHGFLYKFGYMILMCVGCRCRLAAGFILAECGCIAAGMGAYPKHWETSSGEGYKNRKMLMESSQNNEATMVNRDRQERPSLQRLQRAIDFNTVKNIDVWEVESSATLRKTMRSWNQTVQYWLAVNCYKRVPFQSKNARAAATFVISAFWHGVRPGFYLCIVMMVFFQMAEDHVVATFRKRPLFTIPSRPLPKLLFAQLKMTVLAYVTVAFVLVHWQESRRYYQALAYFGHVACVGVLLWAAFNRTRPEASPKIVERMSVRRGSSVRKSRPAKPTTKPEPNTRQSGVADWEGSLSLTKSASCMQSQSLPQSAVGNSR